MRPVTGFATDVSSVATPFAAGVVAPFPAGVEAPFTAGVEAPFPAGVATPFAAGVATPFAAGAGAGRGGMEGAVGLAVGAEVEAVGAGARGMLNSRSAAARAASGVRAPYVFAPDAGAGRAGAKGAAGVAAGAAGVGARGRLNRRSAAARAASGVGVVKRGRSSSGAAGNPRDP
jgi:hypothetical protein